MTDPGTTRDADALADNVLRAVDHDLARPDRDDVPRIRPLVQSRGDRGRRYGTGRTRAVCRQPRLRGEGEVDLEEFDDESPYRDQRRESERRDASPILEFRRVGTLRRCELCRRTISPDASTPREMAVLVVPAGYDLLAQQRHVDQLADELLTAAGWVGTRPPVVVDPALPRHLRARCSIRRGHERVRIHPRVLDEPDAVQRATMAHEIAHLVLGRARGWPMALVATIILWAIAITVVTVALYDGARDDQWGGLSLAVVIALLAWRTSVTPQRRAEYQADADSVALVGRNDGLATLHHLHTDTPRYSRAVAAAGFETHPSPRQRLRHVKRL
jgi:peptidase M48-like protein